MVFIENAKDGHQDAQDDPQNAQDATQKLPKYDFHMILHFNMNIFEF
jgi:hypothetical protein